jgi:hypothetical protein
MLPGAVVATADQTAPNSFNRGSVLTQDLTEDARIYGFFLSMALLGASGNRFGNPSPTYGQGTDYTWTTKVRVQADTTGTACSLATGLLLFLDSAQFIQSKLPSSSASAVGAALGILNGVITFGDAKCLLATGSAPVCTAAKQRLLYRGACEETDAAAAYAAGLIEGLNTLWL